MKLNFTIPERDAQLRTHQIIELCDFLSARVLEPMFEQAQWKWDRQFMNFFTCDNTCEPLDATGKILLRVPRIFLGQTGEIEQRISEELTRLGIKVGPYELLRRNGNADCEFIIPIIENPTADAAPPEVNISQTRGCLVLRDILGFQKVNGRYEFSADELLQRAAAVTEEKIADCTASPVWDPKTSPTVKRRPSPVSMKAIARCLDELKRFAEWAVNHNYRKLAAA